jgi:hypothetical protein
VEFNKWLQCGLDAFKNAGEKKKFISIANIIRAKAHWMVFFYNPSLKAGVITISSFNGFSPD